MPKGKSTKTPQQRANDLVHKIEGAKIRASKAASELSLFESRLKQLAFQHPDDVEVTITAEE